jgi:hypothetical protein
MLIGIREVPLAWTGLLLAAVLAILWAHALWASYLTWGLFQHGLGDDFANYYVQSRLLWSGDPTSIYRLDALQAQLAALQPYAGNAAEPLAASSVPYPALFAWLFAPFTVPVPPVGFALWTGVNLLGLAYLAWRITRGRTTLTRWMCVALFCTSWPLVYQFSLGQPIVLLACAVGECYDALRAEREVRAGLWLSLLIFRPQYGVLLGALLIWKRRWRAALAAMVGVLLILAASVVVSSPATLLEYGHAIQDEGGFQGTLGNPVEFMINWRSLILFARPTIDAAPGVLLTLALGALTIAAAAWAWRGPWRPRDPAFAVQMSVLLLATLIANYHSHVYGAVLLVVPLADALATGYVHRLARVLIAGAAVVPAFVAVANNQVRANHVLTLLLIGLFAVLLIELRSAGDAHDAVGTPDALSVVSRTSLDT